MKVKLICILLFLTSIAASCDMRSGIAKKEMEKYESAPTPTFAPQPTGTPVDPADVAHVDIDRQGDPISVDGPNQNKSVACTKFNRVMVNGDDSVITVTGVCNQIMINGDRNKITADASMVYVFNGSENVVKYSRFANGKQPSVVDNQGGNIAEKVAAQATAGQQKQKSAK